MTTEEILGRHDELIPRLAFRPREAAEALGISERKLRDLLPELPHIRRGGVILIPVAPLEAWLAREAEAEMSRVDCLVSEVIAKIEGVPGVSSRRIRR